MASRKYLNPGLTKSIKTLYLNEETADVHFVFRNDGHRIPAHKTLLYATSQVFRVMLNGCWNEQDEIHIVDATSTAFREFLQFFYLDEIELTATNIVEVTNLGQKYDVVECLDACARFLEYNMAPDNVCLTYQLAILFERDELKKLCNLTIQINPAKVFESVSFLSCDRNVLQNILKMDAIMCSEIDVFNACMEWIKVASKRDVLTREVIQNYIGDFFYDIQFGAMTIDEFASIRESYGDLFSDNERNEVIQMIKLKKYKPRRFNRINRQYSFKSNAILMCKRQHSETCELEHDIDDIISTTFHATGNLLLCGIICAEIFRFGEFPKPLAQNLTGKLTIIETRGRFHGEEVTSVLCTEQIRLTAGKRTMIALTRPVIIRRGIKYEIQLKLQLPFTCCSLMKFNSTTMEALPGVYIKFRNDTVQNGQKRGVIYGLQLISQL